VTLDEKSLNAAATKSAGSIEMWLSSDSNIRIGPSSRLFLIEVIKDDVMTSRTFPPSDRDAKLLVCGGDEGETPLELTERYPKTSRFIASFFE